MELKIGFNDGKETINPVLVDREFNIPNQFPHLGSIKKNQKQRNSKFAFTFSRHNNKIKISGVIGVDLIERMDNLKISDCMRSKAWLTPAGVTPFGNYNNFLFNKQKSIAKRPPPNILLNYYTLLSEHVHCPENYDWQVLDDRDELPDSKEAFNTSQMNTNLDSV